MLMKSGLDQGRVRFGGDATFSGGPANAGSTSFSNYGSPSAGALAGVVGGAMAGYGHESAVSASDAFIIMAGEGPAGGGGGSGGEGPAGGGGGGTGGET